MAADGHTDEAFALSLELRSVRAEAAGLREESVRLRSGLGRSMGHIQLVLSALRDGILLLPPLPPPSLREKMSAKEQYRISAAQEFIHHTRQLMGDLKRDFDGPVVAPATGGMGEDGNGGVVNGMNGSGGMEGVGEGGTAASAVGDSSNVLERGLWATPETDGTDSPIISDASLLDETRLTDVRDIVSSPATAADAGAGAGVPDLGGGGSWETAQAATSDIVLVDQGFLPSATDTNTTTASNVATAAAAATGGTDVTSSDGNHSASDNMVAGASGGGSTTASTSTGNTVATNSNTATGSSTAAANIDGGGASEVTATLTTSTTNTTNNSPNAAAPIAAGGVVITAKALGKLLTRAASVAAGSFSLLRTSGLPPLAHEPSLIAHVFSFLTHREVARASAVCTTWRAVPLRADLVLWRTISAAGALAPAVRAGLWRAIAFSAAGGAGAGGSYEEPPDMTVVASRADALLLRREPPDTDGCDAVPTWPRALLDRLVAHLAGGTGIEGGGGAPSRVPTASAVLAAAAPPAPLHAATVAKLLTPWVARTWGVLVPPAPAVAVVAASDGGSTVAVTTTSKASAGAGASSVPLSEADAALRRIPLTLLAGARGPAARGTDVLSLSRLPVPEALDLGGSDSESEVDLASSAVPAVLSVHETSSSDSAPASVRLFARYSAAAISNEKAAGLIRNAKTAAARCFAVRAEVSRLQDVLTTLATADEVLPDDFSLQFTAAADSARAAAVAARRAEAEAGSAVRVAHADASSADRALVRAVLSARAAWVADVAAAWALKNVTLHQNPRLVTGTAARAAAAVLVLPNGEVVPTLGVRLPDPSVGSESPAARLLIAKRGGAPVGGAAALLSPRRHYTHQSYPTPSLPTPLALNVASPGSLADAIETLLLAGPQESALDFSPLFPLPARLEALLLATAAADFDAAEEAAVGVSSVVLPAGVAGVAVGGVELPMPPSIFPLGSDGESDSDANSLGSSLTIPALPFPASGDLVARDVERTFGDLEQLARVGGVDASTALGSATLLRPIALTPALVARLRRRLTRVLLATAAMDRGISGTPYTQGANYVAAFLLRHLSAPATFWTFSAFFHAPAWALRDVYGAGLWRVGAAFETLHALVPRRLPILSGAFRSAAVHPSTFATGWVMTLFSSFDALPPALVAGGVWDSFFTHGWKSVYRSTLTILEAVTPDVLQRSPDLGEIVTLLHALPPDCLPQSAAALVRHARHWCVPARLLADVARRYDRRAYPARYVAARTRVRARRVAIARAAAGLTDDINVGEVIAGAAAAAAAAAAASAAPAQDVDDHSETDEGDDEEDESTSTSRLRGFFKQGLGGWSRFVAAAVPGLSRGEKVGGANGATSVSVSGGGSGNNGGGSGGGLGVGGGAGAVAMVTTQLPLSTPSMPPSVAPSLASLGAAIGAAFGIGGEKRRASESIDDKAPYFTASRRGTELADDLSNDFPTVLSIDNATTTNGGFVSSKQSSNHSSPLIAVHSPLVPESIARLSAVSLNDFLSTGQSPPIQSPSNDPTSGGGAPALVTATSLSSSSTSWPPLSPASLHRAFDEAMKAQAANTDPHSNNNDTARKALFATPSSHSSPTSAVGAAAAGKGVGGETANSEGFIAWPSPEGHQIDQHALPPLPLSRVGSGSTATTTTTKENAAVAAVAAAAVVSAAATAVPPQTGPLHALKRLVSRGVSNVTLVHSRHVSVADEAEALGGGKVVE